MTRYETLLHLIHVFRPRSIVEVGTWNGDNAVRMIREASVYNKNIIYQGYDLFQSATAQTDINELNVKPHNDYEDVRQKIIAHVPKSSHVQLVMGNTNETLPMLNACHDGKLWVENEKGSTESWPIDFAFIDGGHSIETIASDFNALKHVPIVVMDDYYAPDENGDCPDITKYGCNQLVHSLNDRSVLILPQKDKVKGGGFTQLVLIV